MSGAGCGDRVSPHTHCPTTATTTTSDGATLRAAATAGDTALCCRLLGDTIAPRSSDGTATNAGGGGLLRSVRFSRDELGRNALHLAASGGHTAVLRLLLGVAAPRELDGPDGAGCTAVQRAAADGHEEVVRLLLARGADVDTQDSVHGNTALHEAAWKGYARTVALLCQQCLLSDTTTAAPTAAPAQSGAAHRSTNAAAGGLLLHRCNAGGFTPLHLCCQNGHNQSCRELLLAGCDPDLQNNYGDTALHTAARYGHAGVTRILISAQCRVCEQNKNGDTALHIAAAMGRRKLTRILLEAGCAPAVRNKQRETARDIAARKALQEIMTILDEYGGGGKDGMVGRKDRGREKDRARETGKGGKRSKSKVRFDGKNIDIPDGATIVAPSTTANPLLGGPTAPPPTTGTAHAHWSPYGCHYYPDPEAFPQPRLDSLPHEPLQRGEQYYLDLAGNICKGPVGVGYTCYCAPLFRHLEARLERDRRELQRAHLRLGQRVAGLEQRMQRRSDGRRSERVSRTTVVVRDHSGHRRIRTSSAGGGGRASGDTPTVTPIAYRINSGCVVGSAPGEPTVVTEVYGGGGGTLTRSRSVEQVGGWVDGPSWRGEVQMDGGRGGDRGGMAGARSMDDLDPVHTTITVHPHDSRPTVKELVARIQRKQQRLTDNLNRDPNDPDAAAALEDNDCSESSDDDAQPDSIHQPSGPMGDALFMHQQPPQQPRSRMGVYSPTATTPQQQQQQQHLEPIVRVRNGTTRQHNNNNNSNSNNCVTNIPVMSYGDVNARFAKLRVLDSGVHQVYNMDHAQQHHLVAGGVSGAVGDRDTNNDSGYSTKVYGSSKGNSPSLSGGQVGSEGQQGASTQGQGGAEARVHSASLV